MELYPVFPLVSLRINLQYTVRHVFQNIFLTFGYALKSLIMIITKKLIRTVDLPVVQSVKSTIGLKRKIGSKSVW